MEEQMERGEKRKHTENTLLYCIENYPMNIHHYTELLVYYT